MSGLEPLATYQFGHTVLRYHNATRHSYYLETLNVTQLRLLLYILLLQILCNIPLLADFSCNYWHIVRSSITFVFYKTIHCF